MPRHVATRAVGSYPAFSPLLRTPCGACSGLFSVALSVMQAFGLACPRVSPGRTKASEVRELARLQHGFDNRGLESVEALRELLLPQLRLDARAAAQRQVAHRVAEARDDDLAAIQAAQGKAPEASKSLERAFGLEHSPARIFTP